MCLSAWKDGDMEGGDDAPSLDKLGPEASVFEALALDMRTVWELPGGGTPLPWSLRAQGDKTKISLQMSGIFFRLSYSKACFRSFRFGYSQSASLLFSDIGRSSKVTEVDLKFR